MCWGNHTYCLLYYKYLRYLDVLEKMTINNKNEVKYLGSDMMIIATGDYSLR
jgi:hypothetical protein